MQIRKISPLSKELMKVCMNLSPMCTFILHPLASRICCQGLQIESPRNRLGCRKFTGEHFRNLICGKVKQAGLSRKKSWVAFSHNKSLSRPHMGTFMLG